MGLDVFVLFSVRSNDLANSSRGTSMFLLELHYL